MKRMAKPIRSTEPTVRRFFGGAERYWGWGWGWNCALLRGRAVPALSLQFSQ